MPVDDLIGLLMGVFLLSFMVCVACSSRRWGEKWATARWWTLHVSNAIGSIAFVWCFFLMFTNSPR